MGGGGGSEASMGSKSIINFILSQPLSCRKADNIVLQYVSVSV
jgi:hypothetical protein